MLTNDKLTSAFVWILIWFNLTMWIITQMYICLFVILLACQFWGGAGFNPVNVCIYVCV